MLERCRQGREFGVSRMVMVRLRDIQIDVRCSGNVAQDAEHFRHVSGPAAAESGTVCSASRPDCRRLSGRVWSDNITKDQRRPKGARLRKRRFIGQWRKSTTSTCRRHVPESDVPIKIQSLTPKRSVPVRLDRLVSPRRFRCAFGLRAAGKTEIGGRGPCRGRRPWP